MPSVEVFMTAKNDPVPTTGNEVVPAQRVDSPNYVELVSRYNSFAKHTAKSLVGLIATIAEAEKTLSSSEFERFCKEVRLGGSTLRKWKKIAKEASRLLPVVDQIPNNWTTLYRLSGLKPEKYDIVINDPLFGPSMTAKDIDLILHGGREPKVLRFAKLGIPIDLSETQLDDLSRELDGLSQKYGLKVKLPEQKSVTQVVTDDSELWEWANQLQAEQTGQR